MQDPNELSGREREILKLVATGASNKEIAQQLVISPNTVKVHLKNIFAKIGVASRTEAAMVAVQLGLTQTIAPVPDEGDNAMDFVAENSSVTFPIGSSAAPPVPASRIGWRGYLPIGALILALLAGGFALLWSPSRLSPTQAQASPAVPTSLARWQPMQAMPSARTGLALAAFENLLYAIGGEGLEGITGAVESFNPQTNDWEPKTSKPHPVADVSAVVVGGRIFVPGGREPGGNLTNILEIYDPRQDHWVEGAPLPAALSAYALAAFEGKMYVFGGWDGSDFVQTVYEYDPDQDRWQEHSPLPSARGYAGAASAGGRIYILGGTDGRKALSRSDCYLPDRDTNGQEPWVNCPPLPQGRSHMGVTSLADIVYVIGGESSGGEALPPLAFLTPSNEWQQIQNVSTDPWSDLGLVALGTHLYAIGGKVNQSLTDQHMAYQAIFTVMIPIVR